MLSLSVALKCADIGLLGEQLDTNLRWVGCLEEEFFNQVGYVAYLHIYMLHTSIYTVHTYLCTIYRIS